MRQLTVSTGLRCPLEKDAMTRTAFHERMAELWADTRKQYKIHLARAENERCDQIDKAEDNYAIPKRIMSVVLKELADDWRPPK